MRDSNSIIKVLTSITRDIKGGIRKKLMKVGSVSNSDRKPALSQRSKSWVSACVYWLESSVLVYDYF